MSGPYGIPEPPEWREGCRECSKMAKHISEPDAVRPRLNELYEDLQKDFLELRAENAKLREALREHYDTNIWVKHDTGKWNCEDPETCPLCSAYLEVSADKDSATDRTE